MSVSCLKLWLEPKYVENNITFFENYEAKIFSTLFLKTNVEKIVAIKDLFNFALEFSEI